MVDVDRRLERRILAGLRETAEAIVAGDGGAAGDGEGAGAGSSCAIAGEAAASSSPPRVIIEKRIGIPFET
jgi:hypothetical protein